MTQRNRADRSVTPCNSRRSFSTLRPIARVFSSITSRKNSRRALQRVHFEAGIVRDHHFVRENFGDGYRFDHCVFFKSAPGLQDFRQIALVRQIAERKILGRAIAQIRASCAGLRVARSKSIALKFADPSQRSRGIPLRKL